MTPHEAIKIAIEAMEDVGMEGMWGCGKANIDLSTAIDVLKDLESWRIANLTEVLPPDPPK